MPDTAHNVCPNCQRLTLDVAFYRECQQFAADRAQRAEQERDALLKAQNFCAIHHSPNAQQKLNTVTSTH